MGCPDYCLCLGWGCAVDCFCDRGFGLDAVGFAAADFGHHGFDWGFVHLYFAPRFARHDFDFDFVGSAFAGFGWAVDFGCGSGSGFCSCSCSSFVVQTS